MIYSYDLELINNIPRLRVSEKFNMENVIINRPKAVAEFMNTCFRLQRKAEEYVYMLALNSKLKVVGIFEISHGTVNYATLSPRECFIRACLVGATSIILVHNHPSGDPTPSAEDKKAALHIKAAGKMLCIYLEDFIILGKECVYSLREEDLLLKE